MSTRNFRNREAYRKWLAYGHIHKVFDMTPGHQKVRIRGKPHRVNTEKRGRVSSSVNNDLL
jgi:DNA repair exonuclease SbcCD nuclease subunit